MEKMNQKYSKSNKIKAGSKATPEEAQTKSQDKKKSQNLQKSSQPIDRHSNKLAKDKKKAVEESSST